MSHQHCTHGGKPCPRIFQAVPMTVEQEREVTWAAVVIAAVATLIGLYAIWIALAVILS